MQRNDAAATALAEVAAAVDGAGLHPIVSHALVLMHSDEGAWWPQGMPQHHVDALVQQVRAALGDGTFLVAMQDLERAAVFVGAKVGATLVAAHLALLCERCRAEVAAMAAAAAHERAGGATTEQAKRNATLLGASSPALPPTIADSHVPRQHAALQMRFTKNK